MARPAVQPADEASDHAVELPPDASVLGAIGRGHTLASALADLIDNSIDAGASQVGIQFVTSHGSVKSVRIRDDGCGMTARQLEAAMTLGRRREYGEGALGHFGVGLKEASLSQARVLTVISSSGFDAAAGMRLHREQSGAQIVADVVDPTAAASLLRIRGLSSASGTIVEWSGVENVSVATAYHERRRWFESLIVQLRGALGLTFHRLISAGRIGIVLEELDEARSESGAPRVVTALDPFDFAFEDAGGYPRELRVPLAQGGELVAVCHILPHSVDGPAIRLAGRTRKDSQGVYVYRNDRLLHAGGWLSLHGDGAAGLQLARVSIELRDDALDVVRMDAQKRGVVVRPAAVHALEQAHTDGLTLRGFFDDARAA